MPISEILQVSQHVEKLGIIGVLVVILCVLGYALKYYRTEVIKLHAQIGKLKSAFLIVKNAADQAGVKYDLSAARDVDDLIGERE